MFMSPFQNIQVEWKSSFQLKNSLCMFLYYQFSEARPYFEAWFLLTLSFFLQGTAVLVL